MSKSAHNSPLCHVIIIAESRKKPQQLLQGLWRVILRRRIYFDATITPRSMPALANFARKEGVYRRGEATRVETGDTLG